MQIPPGFINFGETSFLKKFFFRIFFDFSTFFRLPNVFLLNWVAKLVSRSWIFFYKRYGVVFGSWRVPRSGRGIKNVRNERYRSIPFKQNNFQAKILSREKMGAVPVRRHRSGIRFFLRKLWLEGGGVSCFSRDFEIYCLNCPKSAKISDGPIWDELCEKKISTLDEKKTFWSEVL